LEQVLAGPLVHRLERAGEGLRFLRDFLDSAPDELTTFAVFATCPPHEPFPAHLHGQPVFLIVPCWSGPQDEGERLLRPLREFGPPEADLVGPLPYPIFQSMLDGTAPWGLRHYGKSDFLAEDEGRLDEVYGTRTFERLTALKEEFDPTNALRLNHNIAPGRS